MDTNEHRALMKFPERIELNPFHLCLSVVKPIFKKLSEKTGF